MSTADLSFGPDQKPSSHELGGSSPYAMNVTIDESGVVRRRPGIQLYSAAPSSVIDAMGIYSVYEAVTGQLFVVGGGGLRNIYQIVGGVAISRSSNGIQLTGARRPVVAETDAMIVYADGGVPVKVPLLSPAAALLGGSPPQSTHVVAMNARLLMNDISNPSHIRASAVQLGTMDTTGHETWSGLTAGLLQGEARPDPVVSLNEQSGELYVFGSRSLQSFLPDPLTIYSAGVTVDSGLVAPYSSIKVSDKSLAWMDQERRFVIGDARGADVISQPIQNALHDTAVASDCYGYRVALGYLDALVWTLPTDGRTFVYSGGWSQWCQHLNGAIMPFPVLSHFRRQSGSENLVGLTDGRLCRLTVDAPDDLGTPITASVMTGFYRHETSLKKKTWSVKVALMRGTGASSGTVAGNLYYRDDYGSWSDGIPVSVGSPGDSCPVVDLGTIGWPYRMRQWRWEFSAQSSYALASVQEEYEVCAT